ncbi:uncharacterized protein ColSpa_10516 [Colletotrichum spaethianum]|uniref:Uncharacterized protein n=1 Tax=Colletotrichum spaethianum TaxID=700344 RepID=A0AA37PDW7_9PEZI|nr:uncharacterized protein ColSpa_10516 [Colletotrichum spaethianum]GKT50335.1 hypothetical protein ColSpa_10516 [Colletotrichum spaethianum]
MDDVPTSADDEVVQSLAGSPSDALFGLDNSDLGTSAEPNGPDIQVSEDMPSENPTETTADKTMANDIEAEDTTSDETMTVFGGVDSSVKATTDKIPLEPTPATTEDAQTSMKIDIENDEHSPSIEVGDTHVNSTFANRSSAENTALQDPEWRTCKLEIVLPDLSPEERAQYVSITSDVVNEVVEKVTGSEGEVWYKAEFTDGRQDIPASNVLKLLTCCMQLEEHMRIVVSGLGQLTCTRLATG